MSDQGTPTDNPELEHARAALQQGTSLAQHFGLCSETLHLLYVSSLGHYEAGRYALAVQDLSRLIALDTRHADAWALIGNSLMREGQFAEALEAWSMSLHLNPGFGSALQVTRTALALKDADTASVGWVAMVKHASTPDQHATVEDLAQRVLELRGKGPDAPLGVNQTRIPSA